MTHQHTSTHPLHRSPPTKMRHVGGGSSSPTRSLLSAPKQQRTLRATPSLRRRLSSYDQLAGVGLLCRRRVTRFGRLSYPPASAASTKEVPGDRP